MEQSSFPGFSRAKHEEEQRELSWVMKRGFSPQQQNVFLPSMEIVERVFLFSLHHEELLDEKVDSLFRAWQRVLSCH